LSGAILARVANFLLVAWDGGGNVPPFLGIAHQLVPRGHRVRFLGTESLRERVTSTRAECCLASEIPADPKISPDDQIMVYFQYWNGEQLALELLAELEREPADALVVDCMLLGALAAAERSGLPTAVLVHFFYAPSVAGDWGRGWDGTRPLLNPAREKLDLAPLDPDGTTLLDQVWSRTSLVLAATAQEFDYPLEQLAPNVRYVGPVRFDPPGGWTWDLPWDERDPKSLVCVSLSTTPMGQNAMLQRIIDSLESLDARVLVTCGDGVDGEQLRAPANTIVRKWVPHSAVLPHAAVVVTHAGHSTACYALAMSVPLVCMPMGRDQFMVADRVATAGAGVVVAQDAAPEAIRGAVDEVLKQPSYREQAQLISRLIGSSADGALAASELESLLA
jgi:UDP:flavonoid glycosyltransferase YjiC (YdhE family)